MTPTTSRSLGLAAAAAWLVVAGYGLWDASVDSGDSWRLEYTIFIAALTVAAALALSLVASWSRSGGGRALRTVGLVVTALGVALAFVGGWAVPLWGLILGAGYGLVALSTDGVVRRRLAVLAAAQGGGVALQFASLFLSASEDLACGLALVAIGLGMTAGLALSMSGDSAALRRIEPAAS